jgi:hypothetical protein
MKKVWEAIKAALLWIRRIFEDAEGLPSSKRVFGAFLVVSGTIYLFKSGDAVTGGVILGAGLGMFGVSAWGK